jgi:hypothetical protein
MIAPPRERLPNRRDNVLIDVELDGQRWTVDVGLYPDGRPGEIFLSGAKEGSGVLALASDGAVLASLCLQLGIGPRALLAHLGRLGTPGGGLPIEPGPASVIGEALRIAAELDAERGAP